MIPFDGLAEGRDLQFFMPALGPKAEPHTSGSQRYSPNTILQLWMGVHDLPLQLTIKFTNLYTCKYVAMPKMPIMVSFVDKGWI